jgi:hypothetical protein
MMGLGAMGMTSWIFGVVAVATIWGGLWWLLSTIGHQSNAEAPTKALGSAPPPSEQGPGWRQPSFEQSEALTPAPPPSRAKPESDYR